jgi:hypothetical protein
MRRKRKQVLYQFSALKIITKLAIPAPIFIEINSSRNPGFSFVFWIPVFTGMTDTDGAFFKNLKCYQVLNSDSASTREPNSEQSPIHPHPPPRFSFSFSPYRLISSPLFLSFCPLIPPSPHLFFSLSPYLFISSSLHLLIPLSPYLLIFSSPHLLIF